MDEKKPFFRLTSEYSDGTEEKPEAFYGLEDLEGSWQMTRRSWFKGALSVVAILGGASALAGCATMRKEVKISVWNNETGQYETRTLPCGSPIPPGATCICNCIPVTSPAPSTSGRTCRCVPVCTCNKVCTCVPVV